MKKLLVLLCALFLVQGISAQVFFEVLNLESFRHQSTYSIEDDLDNGIDGTDIFNVKGARIFTNLSNLVDGEEHQGDNSFSENTVVIGATSPIYKGYKVTAFYANTNSKQSDFYSNFLIDEWDSDADDVFDRLSSEYKDSSESGSSSANAIILNIGKKMGPETEIAFTYERAQGKYTEEYEDSIYFTDTDVSNSDILELWEGFSNLEYSSSIPVNLYSLSYSKPFKDWKLRGDVYLMSGGMKDNGEELDYWFEDYEPYDLLTTETQLDSALVDYQNEYSANLLGVGLQLSDENKYGVLWEVGGNFGTIFGSGDYQDLDHSREVTQSMIGTDVSVFNYLSRYNQTAPMSVSGMNMGINGRMEWQISENVRFGLGLIANSFSLTMEYDINVSSLVVADYDDGDTEINDLNDYVTTAISGGTLIYTEELNMNSIVIPAGLEVCFGKNKDWFLRLGALSTGSKEETTYTTDITSVQRDSTITVLGDGSSSTTVASSIDYADNEHNEYETHQSVDYVYGLGWKPSPNLSLDLIGMFDVSGVELLSTDWLRSLKLSATINIY